LRRWMDAGARQNAALLQTRMQVLHRGSCQN
jgi:hypothetical protein